MKISEFNPQQKKIIALSIVLIVAILFLINTKYSENNEAEDVSSLALLSPEVEEKEIPKTKAELYKDREDTKIDIIKEEDFFDIGFQDLKTKEEPKEETLPPIEVIESTPPRASHEDIFNRYKEEPKKEIPAPVKVEVPSETLQIEVKEKKEESTDSDEKEDLFYSSISNETKQVSSAKPNLKISAVVHEEVKVSNGDFIKFRITEAVTINEVLIPKNTFVFGSVSISDKRVYASISTIKDIPIKLEAFALIDTQKGIPATATTGNEASKEAGDEVLDQTRISIPFVGSISTNILKRKNREIKATLSEGTKITLK